jgi:hypothetical protein
MNPFIEHTPPALLGDLSYNTTPTLTLTDIPYIHILVSRAATTTPIADKQFATLDTTPIDDESFAVLRLEELSDKVRKELAPEVAFLTSLGLAFQQNGHLYISVRAAPLYGPTGIYAAFGAAKTTVESFSAMKPYTQLLLTYILPGLYWRSYHARQGLPEGTGLARSLDQQMSEISAKWEEIRGEMGDVYV